MTFTEQVVIVGSWSEDRQINVKKLTYILDENGVKIAERLPHRHVVAPGDDLSQEDVSVQAVARGLWTPAVVAAFQAAKNKRTIGGP